jgi:hypothetical protein
MGRVDENYPDNFVFKLRLVPADANASGGMPNQDVWFNYPCST